MKCKTLKSNSGFTLIELIVTIAIMGILMTAIVNVFIFGSNLVNTTQSKFNEHSAALAVENQIKSQVMYAKDLTIYSDPSKTAAEGNSIFFGTNPYVSGATVGTGLVIKTGANTSVFMQNGFAGYSCIVSFSSNVSNTALKVTVTVTKSASDNYTLTQTIPLSDISTSSSIVGAITYNTAGASSGTLIGFTSYTPPT